MHSLAQELTMLTEHTSIEAAEACIDAMRAKVEAGDDPETVLDAEGIAPRQQWLNELTGADE